MGMLLGGMWKHLGEKGIGTGGMSIGNHGIGRPTAGTATLPHPDDIILDSENLLVKTVGPTTEEDLLFFQDIKEQRDLFFELIMFTDTPLIITGDPANQCIGNLGAQWISYHAMLPNRLRSIDQSMKHMEEVLRLRRHSWANDLRKRCEARSLDFKLLTDHRIVRTITISKMEMKFENGLPVPATAKTRRMLKNLMVQQRKL